jgi:hypothetical protein
MSFHPDCGYEHGAFCRKNFWTAKFEVFVIVLDLQCISDGAVKNTCVLFDVC